MSDYRSMDPFDRRALDFQHYFDTSQAGDTQDWAGGTLMRGGDKAYYTDPSGVTTSFGAGANLDALGTSNQYLGDLWKSTYGLTSLPTGGSNHYPNEPIVDMSTPTGENYGGQFTLPTDIFPYSSSSSFGEGSGGGSSLNYSGLPTNYRSELLSSIMPTLMETAKNYPQNIDKYTSEAFGGYNMQLQNALKEILPQIVGNLGNRNILSSTVASDTLGSASRGAISDATTKGYDTAMLSAQLKASLPTVLANIANLGKFTEGSSENFQSSLNTSGSYSADPTVMYRTMADIVMSA